MTKTSDLRLPCDLDAERAVLVAVLMRGERFSDVAGALLPEHFSLENHRAIYRAMADLHAANERIDRISVNGALQSARAGLFPGGPLSYLLEMDHGVPDFPNLDGYVRRLRDRATLRDLQRAGHALITQAGDPDADPSELLEQHRKQLTQLSETLQHSSLKTPTEIIEAAGGLDAYVDRRNRSRGIPTGYKGFDVMTGGLKPGALYILAARPKMGKTALAMNIVERVSVDRALPSITFSLEMSEQELIDRMICARAHVDTQRFSGGYLTPDERKRVGLAAGEIAATERVLIDDRATVTPAEMHAVIRKQQARHGAVGLVVVDYIQLFLKCRLDERVAMMSQISRDLKLIAKDCKVPMLALSQLSRACEARGSDNNVDGYRPHASDLRESGSIEQDADLVASVFRGEVYVKHRPELLSQWHGKADLEVLLQRSGPTGIVPLTFLHESVRFEERA